MSYSGDKYIRDYSFEPEILLERKDSIHVHRNKIKRKRLLKRRTYKDRLSLYIRRRPQTIQEENSRNIEDDKNEDDKASLDELEELNELDLEVEGFYYVSSIWEKL